MANDGMLNGSVHATFARCGKTAVSARGGPGLYIAKRSAPIVKEYIRSPA